MEQHAQKLAKEFGVSFRRAKQALETAKGNVELAIDEILLSPESEEEAEPETISTVQVYESSKTNGKSQCKESTVEPVSSVVNLKSETEEVDSLYSALCLHNSENKSDENSLDKKESSQEAKSSTDLLTLRLLLPPFPSLLAIFHQLEQTQLKLFRDSIYIKKQTVSDGDSEQRPKQVQWTRRKKELLLEKKQRKQREVFVLSLLGSELYLRPLECFDWSKLCSVGSSITIPTLNVLEFFFEVLIGDKSNHLARSKVINTVILKSTFARITKQKRKLLKLALSDPYSPILFFPDSVLDDTCLASPKQPLEESFYNYEREIRAARILFQMKSLDCFILYVDEKNIVANESPIRTIADNLYLCSILSYSRRMDDSRFLDMVLSLYDSFLAENIWYQEGTHSLSGLPFKAEENELEEQMVESEEVSKRTIIGIFRVERNRKIARVSFVFIPAEHFVKEKDSTEDSVVNEEDDETVLYTKSQRLGHLFAPMDQRLPLCIVFGRNLEKYRNQRVVLRFRSWKWHEKYPEAYLVETLGYVGDVEAETRAVLTTCGVRDFDYPTSVFEEIGLTSSLSSFSCSFPSSVCMDKRLDIRNSRLVFSIDPSGSQDIDDALSLYLIKDSIYEVGVHIADFAAWVPSGSFIDVEAMKRGTSVYLVDRRISMIPSVLSENLCSLRQYHDRLSLSVFFFIDFANQGQLVDISEEFLDKEFVQKAVKSSADKGVYFARCILRSCGELHYDEVDCCLKGERTSLGTTDDAQVIQNTRILADIAKMFRQRRIRDGAITNLTSGELRFQFDEEKRIQQVSTKIDLEIMSVVAELMIATNAFVASHLLAVCPNDALLRRHDAPPVEKISQFISTAASLDFLGIHLENFLQGQQQQSNTISTESFISNLEEQLDAASLDNSSWGKLISSLATRAMSEAEYFAASSGKDTRHYALGLDAYTHFTSPIRRYPDVIVHRALLRATGLEESDSDSSPPDFPGALEELAEHLNIRHREAKMASEMSNTLFFSLYFQSQPGLVTYAILIAIQEQPLLGFSVFLPRFSLYGFVPLMDSVSNQVILPALNMQLDQKDDFSEVFVAEKDCRVLQAGCSLRIAENEKELYCVNEQQQIVAEWQLGGTVKVGVWASSNKYREPGVKMLLASRDCFESKQSSTEEKRGIPEKKPISTFQYNRQTKPKEQVVQRVLATSHEADRGVKNENSAVSRDFHRGLFRIWNIRDRDSLKRNTFYYTMTQGRIPIENKIRKCYTYSSDMLLSL
ncbi:DIS3-like exonuclease 1 [Galdieria sulphuraria]|nr:DIS3-like exonuclease 1 [Galdieria sulphuraria]